MSAKDLPQPPIVAHLEQQERFIREFLDRTPRAKYRDVTAAWPADAAAGPLERAFFLAVFYRWREDRAVAAAARRIAARRAKARAPESQSAPAVEGGTSAAPSFEPPAPPPPEPPPAEPTTTIDAPDGTFFDGSRLRLAVDANVRRFAELAIHMGIPRARALLDECAALWQHTVAHRLFGTSKRS